MVVSFHEVPQMFSPKNHRMIESPLLISAKKHALFLVESVDHYPYHNIAHTLEVYNRAYYLCQQEELSEEQTEDVLLASLFHDTGFAKQYPKNEPIGADIAEEFLLLQGIEKPRIERIRNIILATILFSKPQTICEEIIQDADLDNLGRDDCFSRTDAYRRELKVYTDFNELSFRTFTKNLLGTFHFNTKTQKQERSAKQKENFEHFDERYPKDME